MDSGRVLLLLGPVPIESVSMKRQSEVHLLLTADEKTAIQREAQRLGMTVAAWVRYIIRPRCGLDVPSDAPGVS